MPSVKNERLGYVIVEDEAGGLSQRNTLNIVGRGIIADDSGDKSRVRAFDAATMLYVYDNMIGGTPTSGQVGKLGLTFTGLSVTYLAPEAGRPGIIRSSTFAVVGGISGLTTGSSATAITLLMSETFDVLWIVRATSIADTDIRIGIMDDFAANPPANGAYFEKLAADVNWFRVTRAAGVQTRTDTGIAATTGFVKMRVRRISGTSIGFTIDAAAEQTNTTNLPTVAANCSTQIVTTSGAVKTLDHNFFDLLVTELSR
jgi:hypothetical protein